jgi:hypothetical protein
MVDNKLKDVEEDNLILKDVEEVNLIADFEMEFGYEEHWAKETVDEFNEQWERIQEKYKEKL